MTDRAPRNGISPQLQISGHRGGGAAITVHIEFDSFDKAMQFNEVIVDWLIREIPLADGETEGKS
jgi:hypothetical protein